VLGLLFVGIIIDISECIELVGYDIDVVATYAVTLYGDALTFIHTGDGVELAAANLALL
jgi:hypothetical protein